MHTVADTCKFNPLHLPLPFLFLRSFSPSGAALISVQVLCDKNPEKTLKNAYKSHVTAQYSSSNLSALPSSPLAPSGPQPPPLPLVSSHPEPTRDTTATVEEGLPCEFCQKSCPPHKLLSHEAVCPKRPRSRRKDGARVGGANGLAPPTAAGGGSVEVAPCQFCDRPIPLATLIRHETLCQFQREPSLPPPVSPSAVLSSSQTHPTTTATPNTTAHLPQTPDTYPSPSSGQGNTAAVSSGRTPPFTAATTTSQASGLTDDEKAILRHPHNPPTSSSLSSSSRPAPQQMTSGILPTPTVYSRPITASQLTAPLQTESQVSPPRTQPP
ncbi:hypothetical protein GBAR_LOCUS1170 [Geodia barretti]|uniref:Uncharacterized protein n=1 Tax=Geodia barretti TaxID=519541 RepID=A0AA35QUT2_GEOBA|nr:hypothetical protein GBAR_LOCUS1170 [Geodia barretti]